MERLCYHYTKLTVNFSFIVEPHMKLCFTKVAKSDACITPLFANPVTNSVVLQAQYIHTQYIHTRYIIEIGGVHEIYVLAKTHDS